LKPQIGWRGQAGETIPHLDIIHVPVRLSACQVKVGREEECVEAVHCRASAPVQHVRRGESLDVVDPQFQHAVGTSGRVQRAENCKLEPLIRWEIEETMVGRTAIYVVIVKENVNTKTAAAIYNRVKLPMRGKLIAYALCYAKPVASRASDNS